MSKEKSTDGMTEYRKGDSNCSLNRIRINRKNELHSDHFVKLRKERENRIKDTKKLNSELATLDRISK